MASQKGLKMCGITIPDAPIPSQPVVVEVVVVVAVVSFLVAKDLRSTMTSPRLDPIGRKTWTD